MEKYLSLIIGLGSPVLLGIGGLISWLLKTRKEELQAIEERALEKRIDTYNQILHPFIVFFTNSVDQATKDAASKQIGSLEYRKAAFNLITFGSDQMVKSYNSMMQSFYKKEVESDPKATLEKFSNFILSIRKDVNNKNTKLDNWEMLEFMISDIDKYTKK